jgi:predicted ATPase/DNA-binding SARP family transcriptional activator
MLRITTFGGLTITIDQTPVQRFVSRKADALLVYLALEGGEHPRESLSNLLWDDLPPKLSQSYLRTVLSSLQKQLAPYLNVTRYSIGINPEGEHWIDVWEVEQALDAADSEWERRGTLSPAAAEQLEKGLALYRGDFLAGFFVRDCREFENWMLLKQEQLRKRVLDAYYRLGEYSLQRKSYKNGADYLTRALEFDPLLEAAHRLLMMTLIKSGQRSAALAQYQTFKKTLLEELGVEPESETTALYESILKGDIAPPVEVRITQTLPNIGTPFIDRPAELQQIISRLDDPDCRLLTLVGVGGVGKTRLALEAARQIHTRYREGVYFVSFAGIREAGRLFEAIANTLDFDYNGDFTKEENLISYLREREILLVLDNFETMLASADSLSRLLRKTKSLKLLVTSRERLNLIEEWLYPVASLAMPDAANLDQAVQAVAVQLFVQSARRVQPDFDLESQLEDVIRICRAVGGMPLAIELAASWVRLMSCGQIADEVENGLKLLVTTLRNVPERHRSIQAIFEAAWTLLSQDEQRILRQLSIFYGGFQQAAAAAVTGASVITLLSLVDKSLLRSVDQRFELHELLRQFAKEKLDEQPDERAAARQKHSAYFASFLSAAEGQLTRSLPGSRFNEVIREVENIRLAWQTAVELGNLSDINRFLRPLYQLYDAQSNYSEAEFLFGAVVERLRSLSAEGVDLTIARAQVYQGACNFHIDQYAIADDLFLSALPVLEREQAEREIHLSLSMLASSAAARGEYRRARTFYTRVVELLRNSEESAAFAGALFRLASGATMLGEYALSEQYLAEGLAALGTSEHKAARMNYYIHRGDLDVRLGNFVEAQASFEQALRLSIELETPNNHAMILADLAQALIPLGQYERAYALCQESIERNRKIHNRWGEAYGLLHLGRVLSAVGNLSAASLSFDEGITICEQNDIATLLIALLCQRARLHLENGETALASELFSRALKVASARDIPPLRLEALLGMAATAHQNGNNERAFTTASVIVGDAAATFETRQQAERLIAIVKGDVNAQNPATLEQILDFYLA